jgi:glutathione S-transferase
MASVRVHRIPFSTNVERVALAAAHKGVAVEWVDHASGDRSAVEEISGQSLVPVAEFGSDIVRGSMRIVERLEADHPDPPLYPAERLEAARQRIFISWFDRVWKGPPNALDVAGDLPPDAEQLRRRADVWTGWIAGLLGDDRPYLSGASFGAADVCAFPFLKYATIDPEPDDEEQFHHILVDLLRRASHPGLDEWVARVDAHPRA